MSKESEKLKAKVQLDTEKAKSSKEESERNKRSSKKVKDAVKSSKESTKPRDKKDESKSGYSGLGSILSSLLGLEISNTENRLSKENARRIKNNKDANKEKSIYDRLKQFFTGYRGIDNSKKGSSFSKSSNKKKKISKASTIIGMLMGLAPLIVGVFKRTIDDIKEKFDNSWIGKTIKWIKDTYEDITEFIDKARIAINDAIDTIEDFITRISDRITNIFVGIHNFIADFWNKIANSWIGSELGFTEMTVKEYVNSFADTDKTESDKYQGEADGNPDVMASTGNELASKYSNGGIYDKDKPDADSEGKCARHTVDSINSGLPDDKKIMMPYKAADLFNGNELERAGFRPVDKAEALSNPKVGDVVVEDAIPEHPYGHIQIYTGDQTPIKKTSTGEVAIRPWVSDFRQKSTKVHEVEGPKRAWRYGKSVQLSPDARNDNIGLGGSDGHSSTNMTRTTTNTYNNYSNNNSKTIITGSIGAENQRQ